MDSKDMFWVTVTFGIIIAMLALAFWPADKSNVVVVRYDCSVLTSGWHPDVPVRVQEECRKRELNK